MDETTKSHVEEHVMFALGHLDKITDLLKSNAKEWYTYDAIHHLTVQLQSLLDSLRMEVPTDN